jgi:hypothetical protein
MLATRWRSTSTPRGTPLQFTSNLQGTQIPRTDGLMAYWNWHSDICGAEQCTKDNLVLSVRVSFSNARTDFHQLKELCHFAMLV